MYIRNWLCVLFTGSGQGALALISPKSIQARHVVYNVAVIYFVKKETAIHVQGFVQGWDEYQFLVTEHLDQKRTNVRTSFSTKWCITT